MPAQYPAILKSLKMKKPSTPLMLLLALLVSFNVFSIPSLSSLPQAAATIYLDFDGHNVNSAYWNGGNPFTCAPSNMTDAQITETFNRVAEDYRPFEINITTDETKFLSAPLSKRIRIVITPTSSWFTGVGGVSFIGSFRWGDDTPGFVFCDRLGPNNPKLVGECCSHESGHTIGLSHQSKYDGSCTLTATYNEGEGTGETSWAPIMGNSYYRNMSGWNVGPTPYGCNNIQDNLSVITSQNGFGYRADDYSNDININPQVLTIAGNIVNGIISTNTDKDAFSFTLAQNAIIHMDIKPFSVSSNDQGANLDIKMSLYNSARELIKTYDPANTMSVAVDTVLNAGAYYLLIDGAGNTNVTNYGSLGSYSITSSTGAVLAVHNIMLGGKPIKKMHSLHWSVIADEPVKLTEVQSGTDGVQFTNVASFSNTINNFTYRPFETADLYYRIKVTSQQNQTQYSNTIKLKTAATDSNIFTVSTFIQNEITVTAPQKYQYQLSDINGKAIARGNGQAGTNKVNLGSMPAGIYVLHLADSNNQQQTDRIIKQ